MTGWARKLVALCWLGFITPQTTHPIVQPPAPQTLLSQDWMGVYVHGQKIGLSTAQIFRTKDGFLIQERTTLRLNMQERTGEIRTQLDLMTDPEFKMRAFWMHMTSGPVNLKTQGGFSGHSVQVKVHSAGRIRCHNIPADEAPWLTQNLRYRFLNSPPEVGKKLNVFLLDPLTLTCKPLEIFVEGKESCLYKGGFISAFRLLYSWDGLESRAWITKTGETLKEEGFAGFSVVREDPEEARTKGWDSAKALDLVGSTAIPVQTPLPSPRKLTYLKIRFTGEDMGRYAFQCQRQKSYGQAVEVFTEDLSLIPQDRFYQAGAPEPEPENLVSTPFVQCDDLQIRQLAESLVENVSKDLERVRRIERWVYDNLEKIPTLSIPSAIEVLRIRQGDCDEHAILFAALSRAVGIPTKICAGIVYQDGRFCYHAWNEVYLGTWVSVDPSFGQVATDATHIKFVEGDVDSLVKLSPLMGKLKVEILDYR
jgi:hypothetical protein